jgi:peptide deformylase
MIRKEFKTKLEVDIYLAEQKVRMESGYLTRSEREELKQLLDKPDSLIKKEIESIKGKSIITNINELRKPCQEVTKEDNIKDLLKDLKDTCVSTNGWGCSANQVGINKKVSYIRVPKMDQKTKKIEFTELYLINAKIVERARPYIVKNEGCISFPGLSVQTDRYVFITVSYLDEKYQEQTTMLQDYEALAVQHEIDHQNGITIFDRKHKAR